MTDKERLKDGDKRFDEAIEKINKIQETAHLEKSTVHEYSERIKELMVRKRLRKYGNIGDLE